MINTHMMLSNWFGNAFISDFTDSAVFVQEAATKTQWEVKTAVQQLGWCHSSMTGCRQ